MSIDWEKKLENTVERYKNGEVNRRDFIKYLAIAGAGLGLVGGPFRGLARAEWTIRFDGWGGTSKDTLRKHAFKPFYDKTTIKVVDGEVGDPEKFFVCVQKTFPAGGEYNLAVLSDVFTYARYAELGYNVVLKEEKIPNLAKVMTPLLQPLRDITGGKLSAIPYNVGQTGIAYNTKQVSKEKAQELGVGLLWDESLSGKLGAHKDWKTGIWFGALKTDQNPNEIDDMGDVWDALKKQRKLIKSYWNSGSELTALLSKGEIAAAPAWSGQVASLQAKGLPIGFLAPNGTLSWMDYIYVFKCTNVDLAQLLINYMLEPVCALAVAKTQKFPPSLDPTKVSMPDEIKKLPGFDSTGTLEGYTFAKPAYWNSKMTEWPTKWNGIVSGA
jgi:spermidine/putrescine transport system substrate-binding protein